MTDLVLPFVGVVAAFLLGALPFSYWVAKIFNGVDIRTLGSRNAGATNVFRTQGKALGSLALGLDVSKGILAVLLLSQLISGGQVPDYLYKIFLGVAAILGHTYTPFLGWKGGKGVATSAGVFLSLMPGPFGIAFSVFVIVFITSRMISISSLTAAFVFPIAVIVLYRGSPRFSYAFISSLAVACFIFYTHRSNIKRLLSGEEKKLYNIK